MNDATTTGTPTLGRWQLPAALINAGRVTPDPYPLEQILFCATCSQQFFGTHLTNGTNPASGTRVPNGTHLTGTRVPDCTHVAGSVPVTCGTHATGSAHQPGGVRVYRTSCDCRPEPLPASEVELRVYAETHVAGFGTNAVTGLTTAHYALLAIRFFTRIEVGSTSDDIAFTNRI